MSSRDQSLIAECLAGRTDAFGELIAPYQDRLYNTIVRLVGRPEDAAELFQESLIRAYRGLGSYQGGSSFYTWFYRVAINVVFTNRRRVGPRMISTDAGTVHDRFDLADPLADGYPSRRLEQAEQRELIERALASVPEPYRVVLVLKDIEGLKYEDIADILSIPIGTVRSRLHRARGELKERLQPLWDQGKL